MDDLRDGVTAHGGGQPSLCRVEQDPHNGPSPPAQVYEEVALSCCGLQLDLSGPLHATGDAGNLLCDPPIRLRVLTEDLDGELRAHAAGQLIAGMAMGGMKMTPEQMQSMMSGWPQASKDAAMFMTQKYGAPAAMTSDMAAWGKTGP